MTDSVVVEEASLELLISELADEFADQLARGEQPRVEDYAARCPEHSGVIRQVLASLELIRDASQSLGTRLAAADAADQAVAQGQLGDFRILREIGRGGMGVVYEAEQISLNRRVALKILPFAAMLDQRSINRFRNEAQSAALLHHQNIVPVYAVGCERGVHFYAMPLIEGQTLARLLAEWRKEHRLVRAAAARSEASRPAIAPLAGEDDTDETENTPGTPAGIPSDALGQGTSVGTSGYYRRIAELTADAALALDHAHGEGVIHRDIKPSNLILDQGGRIWITDFGLARMGHGATLTRTGDVVGTLRYMSPEQAQGDRAAIDHRSDVYSLGVTLYELLTLRPAFAGDDRQSLLARIVGEEPPAPRKVDARIPAELETIVLKAISKLPEQRYSAAREMADDLRRYLDDRPILARRPTWRQRIARWSRRHRAAVTTGLAGLFVLLAATIVFLFLSGQRVRREQEQTEKQKERAEQALARETDVNQRLAQALSDVKEEQRRTAEARGKERWTAYVHGIALAEREWRSNRLAQARSVLESCPQEHRDWEWRFLQRLCQGPSSAPLELAGEVVQIVFSGDGARYAVLGSGVQLHDAATRRVLHTFDASEAAEKRFYYLGAFTADSRQLAVIDTSSSLSLLDAASGTLIRRFRAHAEEPRTLALSPDGKLAATATHKELKLWRLETGEEALSIPGLPSNFNAAELAFAEEGQTLVAVCHDSAIRLFSSQSGLPTGEFTLPGPIVASAVAAGGRLVATSTRDGVVRIHELPSFRETWRAFQGGTQQREYYKIEPSLVFSLDGQRLAALGGDNLVRILDVESGRPLELLRGLTREPQHVAFSHDAARFFAISRDERLLAWDLGQGENALAVATSQWTVTARWDADSRRVHAAVSVDPHLPTSPREIASYSALSGERIPDAVSAVLSGSVLDISPDGRRAVLREGIATEPLTLRDRETGELLHRFAHPRANAVFGPDGRRLATLSFTSLQRPDAHLVVWDIESGERLLDQTIERDGHNFPVLACSADSESVVIPGRKNWVEVLSVGSRARQPLGEHIAEPRSASFRRDGTALAVGTFAAADGQAQVVVWDLRAKDRVCTIAGFPNDVSSVAFHPDGTRIATASLGVVQFFDARSGSELLTLTSAQGGVRRVEFSADGQRLLALFETGEFRIWSAE